MARKFTIEVLMNLAKAIGANPNKFMGTKTNITFLGKGPTKNPLFQNRLAGLENASVQNLGKPETLVSAVEDAMSFATAGKLNNIQTEILGHNLLGIKNIVKPPPLPSASVTPIRAGIETVGRKGPSDIEQLIKHGHTDARGRRWEFSNPGAGERLYDKLTGRNKPRLVNRIHEMGKRELPEPFGTSGLRKPGPGDLQAFQKALDAKTGMSRAIARQILQQDTRLKLNPQELYSLRTGARGEDPLDLMKKYYGESMLNFDDFLNNVIPRPNMNPGDIATRVLAEVKLTPQFAHGGLARILEV